MRAPLTGRSIADLNRDYLDALQRAEELDLDPALRRRLAGYRRFVEQNAHRLGPYPAALSEVALAEPQDSLVRADAETLPAPGRPWFRRLHAPPTDPNPALVRTLEGHTGAVNAVVVSPDGRLALSGGIDRTVRVWDLATGACRLTLQGHTGWVKAVAVSPDGRLALSGSWDGTVRVWDLHNGECLTTLPCGESVWSVAISPVDRQMVFGLADGQVQFFRLENLPGGTEGERAR